MSLTVSHLQVAILFGEQLTNKHPSKAQTHLAVLGLFLCRKTKHEFSLAGSKSTGSTAGLFVSVPLRCLTANCVVLPGGPTHQYTLYCLEK